MHFLDAEQVEWLAAATERRYRPLDPVCRLHRAASLRAGGAADRSAGSASLHRASGGGRGGGQSAGVGAGQDPRGAHRPAAALGCRRGCRLARRPAPGPGGAGVHRSQGWSAEPGRFRQVRLPAGCPGRQRGDGQAAKTSVQRRRRMDCGSTTFGTPGQVCSSPRARASRPSRRSSGMRPPASRSTPTGTCSRPRWIPSGTAWSWSGTRPWSGWADPARTSGQPPGRNRRWMTWLRGGGWGFEPSRELPPYTLSRRVPSTARPSLRRAV